MAIKLPDPGNGIPEQKTGNDEWTNMKIVRDNFADQSNAASRLVGKNGGNLLEAGTGGIGWITTNYSSKEQRTENGFFNYLDNGTYDDISGAPNYQMSISVNWVDPSSGAQILIGVGENPTLGLRAWSSSAKKYVNYRKIYFEGNTTKDSNGFLKAASPVVDLYDDRVELNGDAEIQGIELIKNGKGDYTLKTKTGLRSDNTWQTELPQDNNKNPLFAVAIDTKDDGTIHIKCYKRIFNMQTFMFEPDLDSPVDITEGRFISVRLNDNPEPEQLDEPTI